MRLTLATLAAGFAALMFVAAPGVASASYMGPGLGLGAVSVALGVVGATVLGLASIIWYPLKRLVRRSRRRS